MILLRTHAVDARLEAFAQTLEAWSAMPVRYLVDERKGSVDTGARGKVSLTREACEAIGLYCPHDFAWRCGDYGFYLARRRFPDVAHFWLIENDVRIAGRDPGAFFRRFAQNGSAAIASFCEEASPHWAWIDTVVSRDATPYKCFFPVVRLAADAIDLLLARRQAHAAQWARRRLWPNDEGFVATTMLAAGVHVADLNDDAPVYDPAQFSFETLRDGAAPLDSAAEVALFHPVLFGEALERKRARLARRQPHPGRGARLAAKVKRHIGLDAVARRLNRRACW